ncbi:15747_t:CDS:2 [Gigaspora rosea]|nr:15747_t:CDS:2 [Gigaspora rosea]
MIKRFEYLGARQGVHRYKILSNLNPIIPKIPSSKNVTILFNPNSNIIFQGPFPPIIANSFSSKKVSDTNRILKNSFTIWNCIIMILGLLFVRPNDL